MTKQLIKIIFLLTIFIVLIGLIINFRFLAGNSTAQAAGELTIDWGVPNDQPLFVITNILPGDTETRLVGVTNDTMITKSLVIKGIKISEINNLSSQLSLTIKNNNDPIYGPNKLATFFIESNTLDGIPLGNLDSNTSSNFSFDVLFDPTASNEFQNASIVFDLIIGFADSQNIPAECNQTRFDKIIYGTPRSDILRGGNGNNLIFGLGGSDIISGHNSTDCLVGGPGSDILFGGKGNDVILGSEGNDIMFGDNGNDTLFGGLGQDIAIGGNGKNTCQANIKLQCSLKK